MNDMDARMKMYEGVEGSRRFLPLLPVCARLDGKCFHKFTKGLERPFDQRFRALMQTLTIYLVKETCACMGYTQSDEITLTWYSDNIKSQIFYDGRIQKLNSVLAAVASVEFGHLLPAYLPEKVGTSPVFDCRVWQLPTLAEGANVFLWREFDAVRNSISAAANSCYSDKQLYKKNSSEMQEMLFQKGINWNDYPAEVKRGFYAQRKHIIRKFTTGEIEKLPPRHEARKNPDLTVERAYVEYVDMPIFSQVTNRKGVIFKGEDPICTKG